MDNDASPVIKEKAGLILAEVERAKSILLHCHPSPDPDSLGSVLAMKFVLEGMGKKVTVIKGDSDIPQAFMGFPGAKDIVQKNFLEMDPDQFDLFIALDSGSRQMISRRGEVVFPQSLTVVNIDHHASNENYGRINLVVSTYPSCTQVLYDLFKCWNVKLDGNIAANLFIGTYTDTGGFRYRGTTERTFAMAAELVRHAPNFADIIFAVEESNTPVFITFQREALNNVEIHLNGKLALTSISNAFLKENNVRSDEMSTHFTVSMLRSVIGWDITVVLLEVEPNKVKVNFRTRNAEKYDMTAIATVFGGGGHKAAAGATLSVSLEEAKKIIVSRSKELYNL